MPISLARALGSGQFPRLTVLSAYLYDEDHAVAFREGLIASAAAGTSSRIRKLRLGVEDGGVGLLDQLMPIFAAGGLPSLVDLEVYQVDMPENFPESWTALGGKIKIERLRFDMYESDETFAERYLEALTNLSFCPSLRVVKPVDSFDDDRVQAALETRRQRREARAAASLQERTEALEARVGELEAQVKTQDAKLQEQGTKLQEQDAKLAALTTLVEQLQVRSYRR